jgi:lysophospholipase L1-like esterase
MIGKLKALKCVAVALVLDGALAVVVVVVVGTLISEPTAPPFSDPNPDSPFKIVALGDSYMSGEGAEQFFAGTDRSGVNTCRRAPTAYPLLAAQALKASLVFAACSGATTADILAVGQEPEADPNVSGGEPQIEILKKHPDASVVLVSIGGNDAGFAHIAGGCTIGGDCRRNADFWLRALDRDVYPRLVATYRMVKKAAPRAQDFVVTYPVPVGPKHCNALPIGEAEEAFLRDEFVPRLNLLIKFAALVAQVGVVDLEHALDKNRICEVPGPAAVNVIGLGRTRGDPIRILDWGHDSFHPNALGHSLMAKIVTGTLQQYVSGSLPPLPDAPPPGITPPPYVPSEIGVPVGPYDFPVGTDCIGDDVARVIPVAAPNGQDHVKVRIADAKPFSRACYHGYKEAWRSTN